MGVASKVFRKIFQITVKDKKGRSTTKKVRATNEAQAKKQVSKEHRDKYAGEDQGEPIRVKFSRVKEITDPETELKAEDILGPTAIK